MYLPYDGYISLLELKEEIQIELHQEIWEWSTTLPDWQNDLLRRLYEKRDLSETEISQVSSNILASVGEHPHDPIIEQLTKEKLPESKTEKGVKLKSLGNMVNVAAVDEEYEIEFNTEGLTVVYGDNSAGKSSYAKVLKQACRAVDNNTIIHPNIYQNSKSNSSANIQIVDDDQRVKSIQREMNTSPDPQLSHISIYDSKCGQVYAETENSVVFVPSELQIFNLLANYQSSIKKKLLKNKESLILSKPKLPKFKEGTKTREFMDNFSGNTTHEEIKNTCTFTEEDQKRLEQINEDLGLLLQSNPDKNIRDLYTKIKDAEILRENIKKIIGELENREIDEIEKTHRHYIDARETLKVATDQAFHQQPLKNVGSNPWMKLWEAAREYNDLVYQEIDFPNTHEGAKCLLCQQDLNESGRNRLNTFEEFIQSKISKEKDRLEKLLIRKIESVKDLPIEKIKDASIREYIQADNLILGQAIKEFIDSVNETVLKIIESKTKQSNIDIPNIKMVAIEDLNIWIRKQSEELERKKQLAEPDKKSQLTNEKNELESKQEANKVIDDLHKLLDKYVSIGNYDKAIAHLSTTNITKKYNILASSYITTHFKTQIEKELNNLRCDNVLFDVKSRGVKGQTTIKLTIDSNSNIDLIDIFSEGEQKALSLAFFFAEVSSMRNKGAIILDDPVSSFDQGRREYVARRLVEEANDRQVIVFTHDIVFLHTLEKFGKVNRVSIKRNVVRRIGKTAGVISNELPWVAQGVKKRVGYLKNELQKLKSQQEQLDPDQYYKEVKSWYSLLREGWERSVEELMFGGVIERFNPSVNTQLLKDAKVNEELIQIVEESMTKTSTFVHDESPAIGRLTPSMEEMEADIQSLDKFRKQFV